MASSSTRIVPAGMESDSGGSESDIETEIQAEYLEDVRIRTKRPLQNRRNKRASIGTDRDFGSEADNEATSGGGGEREEKRKTTSNGHVKSPRHSATPPGPGKKFSPEQVVGGKNLDPQVKQILKVVNCRPQTLQLLADAQVNLFTFLTMQEKDLVAIGVTDTEERLLLLNLIQEIHRRPWKESSIMQPPAFQMESYKLNFPNRHEPPNFACTELGALIENLHVQLNCMQASLVNAQRIVAAYKGNNDKFMQLGYAEDQNVGELQKALKIVGRAAQKLDYKSKSLSNALNYNQSSDGFLSYLRSNPAVPIVGLIFLTVGAVIVYKKS